MLSQDVKQTVLDMDRQGIPPRKIHELTGIGFSTIAYVKRLATASGLTVTRFNPNRTYGGPKKVSPVRKPARQFCKCGLTLPCNSCLDEVQFGRGEGGLAIWERGRVYTG